MLNHRFVIELHLSEVLIFLTVYNSVYCKRDYDLFRIESELSFCYLHFHIQMDIGRNCDNKSYLIVIMRMIRDVKVK